MAPGLLSAALALVIAALAHPPLLHPSVSAPLDTPPLPLGGGGCVLLSLSPARPASGATPPGGTDVPPAGPSFTALSPRPARGVTITPPPGLPAPGTPPRLD